MQILISGRKQIKCSCKMFSYVAFTMVVVFLHVVDRQTRVTPGHVKIRTRQDFKIHKKTNMLFHLAALNTRNFTNSCLLFCARNNRVNIFKSTFKNERLIAARSDYSSYKAWELKHLLYKPLTHFKFKLEKKDIWTC